MAPLQAAYDFPSGRLTAATLKKSVSTFVEHVQARKDSSLSQVLGTMLGQAQSKTQGVVANGNQVAPSKTSKLLAVIHVTRICRGPVGDDVIDERFGTVHLTLKGGVRGIFPVVWGTFDACVDHAEGGTVMVDGDYWLDLNQGNQLYRFEGIIQAAGARYDGVLDFRELADGTTEVRVPGAGGDVILGVDAQGRGIARDRDHTWICDFSRPTCSASSGEVLVPENAS